jgi:sugar lactone lactonase YvrE
MLDALCAQRALVGESPLWSVAEQALYWVDIEGRSIHRFAAGAHRSWPMAERVGCIALHAQGGLLAAMETGLFAVRPGDDGTVATSLLRAAPFAAELARSDMRFNDGRTDRRGRFWVTGMVRNMALADPAGALYCCAPGQRLEMHVGGLVTGNGLAFSPNGGTLYLSDSHPSVQLIWAFDLDGDGRLSNRRLFVDMNQHPGRPDGAAVDEDGCYWSCANDAGAVHRFTPAGRLDRTLRVPVAKPSMCAFGGPRLDELFITSITPPSPIDGYDAALAGAVFVTRPGVRGIAETPFGSAAPASPPPGDDKP